MNQETLPRSVPLRQTGRAPAEAETDDLGLWTLDFKLHRLHRRVEKIDCAAERRANGMIRLVLFASGGLNIFMQTSCLFSFLVATTAWLSLGVLPSNQASAAVTHTVQFRNFEFDPATLTVNRGDTVIFQNQQGSHTVTGTGTDPFCGQSAVPTSCSVTFNAVGTFPYRCIFHSSAGPAPQGMVGTIVVEEAVQEKANVTPFAPPGWSDKIIVSTTEGTLVDETELFSDQDLFIDWSVVNTSLTTGITAPFQTHLFVDGLSLFFWTHDPLPPDTFHRIFDKNIGKLSAGDHTLRIWTDVTSLVDESDENDNQYQKVITVKARSAQTHTVQFKNFQFDPPALTVKVGDSVVFENSGGDHTVTGTGADPFCGTGAIPVSCQVKFATPGTYPYRCIFHSSAGPPPQGMVGTITVEAQGSVLALQSSATVEGPYSIDAAASIDATTGTVRLPLPLASRYFRLMGPTAVRFTGIRVVGDQLEFSFE
jgi:plastocyanin